MLSCFKHFMFAYGPDPMPLRDSNDFAFNNPFLRITRFCSIFDGNALLTDPVVFLERLHKKKLRYGRILLKNLLVMPFDLHMTFFSKKYGFLHNYSCKVIFMI